MFHMKKRSKNTLIIGIIISRQAIKPGDRVMWLYCCSLSSEAQDEDVFCEQERVQSGADRDVLAVKNLCKVMFLHL